MITAMNKRFSILTRRALLLGLFFAFDKALAIIRQVIIARQFGLSKELDAFNVANNVPDLLFALITGGTLAVAFIPVLTEVLTKEGRSEMWNLFSRIANLAFIITGVLALLVAVMASQLVGWQFGIAPGFGQSQQALVVTLMRLNLVATLLFSISGLVMAGLQANQHFLLPAIAPLLYNLGQIIGALVLSPDKGYHLGPIILPHYNLGVYGLVIGVIIGAALHLAIQIPGLLRYKFHWIPGFSLKNENVVKVLRMMGPRLITMLFIQLVFIVRDNLASRLAPGAVSALTYGWMIMQVPETLIGTAVGTALLPSLAELLARGETEKFRLTIERAMNVLLALTIPVAVILPLVLRPFIGFAFAFDSAGTNLLLDVTRFYLVGLAGQCLLEVAARSFYAQQNALYPLLAAMLNVVLYTLFGIFLFRWIGAPGISLSDSLAFTSEAVLLILLQNRRIRQPINLSGSLLRGLLAGVAGFAAISLFSWITHGQSSILLAIAASAAGLICAIPFILKDIRQLAHL
jgi:putative peptidoglycan lipid II flippase